MERPLPSLSFPLFLPRIHQKPDHRLMGSRVSRQTVPRVSARDPGQKSGIPLLGAYQDSKAQSSAPLGRNTQRSDSAARSVPDGNSGKSIEQTTLNGDRQSRRRVKIRLSRRTSRESLISLSLCHCFARSAVLGRASYRAMPRTTGCASQIERRADGLGRHCVKNGFFYSVSMPS